jgi:Leucine-rich repeat (LRR) protein
MHHTRKNAISVVLRQTNFRRFGILFSLALMLCLICQHAHAGLNSGTEYDTLASIYSNTNGPAWINKTGWLTGDACSWYGVFCDQDSTPSDNTSHVVVINLNENNLSGTLPSLVGLSHMTDFVVDYNFIGGSIPSLTGMTALQDFRVDWNQFQGSIPPLGSLSNLYLFGAADNQLTGSIPSLLGTKLTVLVLSNNELSGAIPSITGLHFQQFFVDGNQLSGPIPSLADFANSSQFVANNNKLTGPIPAIGTNIHEIDVSSNQLSGTIPSLLGTGIVQFRANNNQLTGQIPPLNGITGLQDFSVSGNQLNGTIPYLAGTPNIEIFDVSANQLQGPIPTLATLTGLIYFIADRNQLTGSIPSLSGMTKLQLFFVGLNQLSGSIPPLSDLSSLGGFSVGSNNLTGPVPALPASFNSVDSATLCPNPLDTTSQPSIDPEWDTATGYSPWWAVPTATSRCDEVFKADFADDLDLFGVGTPFVLGFPLPQADYPQGPYTPGKVHTMLDHGLHPRPYLCHDDGQIVSFTGEVFQANGAYPEGGSNGDACGSPCYPKDPGQNMASSWSLTLDSLYSGTSGTGSNNCTKDNALNYEGHPGYDYDASYGTPVMAASAGYVVSWRATPSSTSQPCIPDGISNCAAWGYVGIDHINGYITQYGHLSQINVTPGQLVHTGQIIGYSGYTGLASNAAHLHFEVLFKDTRPTPQCSLLGGGGYTLHYCVMDPYGWLGGSVYLYGTDPLEQSTNLPQERLWFWEY